VAAIAFFAVIAVALGSACDDDISRIAARVDSVQDGKVCITAEGADTAYLNGCHTIDQRDAARIHAGDCIAVAIPYSGDPENPAPSVTLVRVLDRDCTVRSTSTTSSG